MSSMLKEKIKVPIKKIDVEVKYIIVEVNRLKCI